MENQDINNFEGSVKVLSEQDGTVKKTGSHLIM